ncbi:MAG TPA: cardiolipin synthase [Caldilineaceae bacterium]|nr:cardiolipin synthase [Caldilineaceae bacterium]
MISNLFELLGMQPLPVPTVLWLLYTAYLVGSIVFIIMDNREPSQTLAWIFSFLALPVVGLVIYFFFGRNTQLFSQKQRLVQQAIGTSLTRQLTPLAERQAERVMTLSSDFRRSLAQRRLVEMLHRTQLSAFTVCNEVEILQDAQEKYPRLIADIEAARDSIHMEYFTWQADPFMQDFGDLLIRKAREGVEVRILFDTLGSHFLLWRNRRYLNRLRRGGVQIYPYLNFLGLLRLHTINYRNHRKIAVIDGKIGYTGGMNMGEEQLNGAGPYGGWRDTHLRLTGDVVAILQGIFITSWYNTTNERLTDRRYFPNVERVGQCDWESGVPLQVVLSGPDSQWYAIQQLYFLMITAAQRHVYIQSPFFIPDPAIAQALKVAAMSGVDVKLMCAPRDTAWPLSNWAANTYFAEMARAGVRVFLYQPAYMHAKTVSIDSAVCSIGTANVDMRSFHINYEMNVVIYDAAKTRELEAAFVRDLEHCIEFNLAEYRNRPGWLRLRDSVARLFSPLL